MTTSAGSRLIDRPEVLRARLRAAPPSPGVYVMRGVDTRVIYVGKAARVRDRLRSYFTGIDTLAPRTRHLVERVHDFEVLACASEREALILENTLIKRYRPRFNVRLKDDKNYLYLKIPVRGTGSAMAPGTAREEARAPRLRREGEVAATDFPRPYYSRRMARDGARYFGPYTSAQSLRSTVRSLRTIFPFRTCSDETFRRGRVCLDYHIKRCSGPCEGRIDAGAYAELLDDVERFMHGDSRAVETHFTERMNAAAGDLQFEVAARYRDRLAAMARLAERQRMVATRRTDEDVLAVAADARGAVVAVMSVRQGRVVGMETHELDGTAGSDEAEQLAAFVAQYYDSSPSVPRTIVLSALGDEATVLNEFLAERRGGPVDLRVPQRGRSREMVAQAQLSAEAVLRQKRVTDDYDAERTGALLDDLAARLGLDAAPRRIECYDISNTMGTNSVGSMVVFEDGRPATAHYRHFGIRTVEGPDDFASMRETLRRRFTRYLRDAATAAGDVPVDDPEGSNGGLRAPRAADTPDESFALLPDLIIIDGGKGQLHAAHDVLVECGLDSVPVFGLAKREEELFRPGNPEPLLLPRDSPTLFLVQRVRDEAHRFAITRHRARRGRAALTSRLDVVSGLGPARKRALLRHFGTIERIREATVEEILEVPGIPRSLALRLKELL